MSTSTVPAQPAAAPEVVQNEEQTKAIAMMRQAIPVQFDPNDPVALYMNTGVFEQLQRVAKLMASSELVPAHLRGKQADCFLVAAQAFRWRMDPFSVAQHTYVTKGKLGYEGKLIAALINASGRTKENLKPIYSGAKGSPDRKVTIVGTLKGESEVRDIEGTVKEWKTDNEKWTSMPDQMLFYRGAREWSRRHMPEVVLGMTAEEEIDHPEEPSEVVPRRPALDLVKDRLRQASESPAEEPTGEPEPEPCSHPEIPPERLAATPSNKKLVCNKCGEELAGTAPVPEKKAAAVGDMKPAVEREPGSDDGDPVEEVQKFAQKAAAQPGGKSGQRRLE